MGILNTGRNKVINYLKSDISKGQLGTDGTLFNEAQTGVISPIASTNLAITTSDITNGLKVSYELPEGTGNNISYKEFEIISSDGTTSYARIVIPQFDKDSTQKLFIDSYYQVDINNE